MPGDATNNVIKIATGGAPELLVVESDVIVYKASGTSDPTYSASSLTSITRGASVWAYDTKGKDDLDGVATIIIWVAK
jgi:hypothetical protein